MGALLLSHVIAIGSVGSTLKYPRPHQSTHWKHTPSETQDHVSRDSLPFTSIHTSHIHMKSVTAVGQIRDTQVKIQEQNIFLAPVDVEMLHLSPYNSKSSILINLLITINT